MAGINKLMQIGRGSPGSPWDRWNVEFFMADKIFRGAST